MLSKWMARILALVLALGCTEPRPRNGQPPPRPQNEAASFVLAGDEPVGMASSTGTLTLETLPDGSSASVTEGFGCELGFGLSLTSDSRARATSGGAAGLVCRGTHPLVIPERSVVRDLLCFIPAGSELIGTSFSRLELTPGGEAILRCWSGLS